MQNNTLSRPGFSLSGTALKRIACLSMLVDHLGASLLENGLFRCSAIDPRLVGLDQLLRLVGRLAFPIYCFLLVEGFLHTHDLKNTPCGCWASPSSSEGPFDWALLLRRLLGDIRMSILPCCWALAGHEGFWIHPRRRRGCRR